MESFILVKFIIRLTRSMRTAAVIVYSQHVGITKSGSLYPFYSFEVCFDKCQQVTMTT